MHIAIEGIDGVGKSTAAKNLANELGFQLIEKPLHYLFDADGTDKNYIRIRDEVNKSKNKTFTGWFYGLGNIYLYEKFKGKNIITDRHILSNYCWSGDESTDYIFDAIYKATGAPDFTFLIYADPKAVEKRLKSRDRNDPDLKKVAYIPTAYEKMQRVLKRYGMSGMIIDSTDLTEAEVVDTMKKELVKRGIIDG
ncbi:MAG: AAA family ATPase [Clostridiales bacterium]|nr:AAA family ATPase [Clostridiales bacterium]